MPSLDLVVLLDTVPHRIVRKNLETTLAHARETLFRYAPTLGVGYEHVASGGLTIRPMIGANAGGPTIQLLLGAKLW